MEEEQNQASNPDQNIQTSTYGGSRGGQHPRGARVGYPNNLENSRGGRGGGPYKGKERDYEKYPKQQVHNNDGPGPHGPSKPTRTRKPRTDTDPNQQVPNNDGPGPHGPSKPTRTRKPRTDTDPNRKHQSGPKQELGQHHNQSAAQLYENCGIVPSKDFFIVLDRDEAKEKLAEYLSKGQADGQQFSVMPQSIDPVAVCCMQCSQIASNPLRCLTCERLMCNDCCEEYQKSSNDKCLNPQCESTQYKVGLATAEQTRQLELVMANCAFCQKQIPYNQVLEHATKCDQPKFRCNHPKCKSTQLMNKESLVNHFIYQCKCSPTTCKFCKHVEKRMNHVVHRCYDFYKQQAIQSENVNLVLFNFIANQLQLAKKQHRREDESQIEALLTQFEIFRKEITHRKKKQQKFAEIVKSKDQTSFCVHFQTKGHCPNYEKGQCKYNHDLSSARKKTERITKNSSLCAKFVRTFACEEFEAGNCQFNHNTAKAIAKRQILEDKKQRQMERRAQNLLKFNQTEETVPNNNENLSHASKDVDSESEDSTSNEEEEFKHQPPSTDASHQPQSEDSSSDEEDQQQQQQVTSSQQIPKHVLKAYASLVYGESPSESSSDDE